MLQRAPYRQTLTLYALQLVRMVVLDVLSLLDGMRLVLNFGLPALLGGVVRLQVFQVGEDLLVSELNVEVVGHDAVVEDLHVPVAQAFAGASVAQGVVAAAKRVALLFEALIMASSRAPACGAHVGALPRFVYPAFPVRSVYRLNLRFAFLGVLLGFFLLCCLVIDGKFEGIFFPHCAVVMPQAGIFAANHRRLLLEQQIALARLGLLLHARELLEGPGAAIEDAIVHVNVVIHLERWPLPDAGIRVAVLVVECWLVVRIKRRHVAQLVLGSLAEHALALHGDGPGLLFIGYETGVLDGVDVRRWRVDLCIVVDTSLLVDVLAFLGVALAHLGRLLPTLEVLVR